MTVISVDTDDEHLTVTVIAEFDDAGGAGVGAVDRPAQARTVVGSALLPGPFAPTTWCPAARPGTS